jgi:hypothetical protein
MSCDDKDTPSDIAQEVKKTGYLINDGGDGTADFGTDDLDTDVKNCLGKYLSTLTQGKSDTKTTNKFYVDGDNENIDLSNTDGTPVGPTVNTNNASHTSDSFQPWLSQYSNSEYADEGKKNLGNFLSKGGLNKETISPTNVASAPWDGHELLKYVATDDQGTFTNTSNNPDTPTGAVQKYTSQVLAGFNRFDVGENRSFSPKGNSYNGVKESDEAIVASVQKTLGTYQKDSQVLKHGTLRKIGSSLSLRSSLENSAVKGVDPDSALAKDLASLLPGGSQLLDPFSGAGDLGTEGPVNAEDLRAYKVLSDLLLSIEGDRIASDEIRKQNVDINTTLSNKQKSLGNMNNNVDIFSGLLPVGMITLHITLALVLFVTVEALALIFGLLAKPSRLAKDRTGANRLGIFVEQQQEDGLLGDFLGGLGKIATFMGVKPFTFNFQQTVTEGLFVYLGLEPPINAEDLKEFALDAPGYYATMSRMAIRSVQSISRAFDQVAGGSLIDVTNSITGIVQAIRESKIIKLINYYAQLGDKRLSLVATGFENEIGTSDGFAKISGVDKLSTNISPLVAGGAFKAEVFDKVRKNRLSNRRKLAWSNSTANSMLLLPNSIVKAAQDLRLDQAGRPQSYNKVGKVKPTEFAKISAEERRDLEAWLDAEYVPFYFHDVRTNEIISFHAFLSTLNESYTANYETSNGFGRVDPVRAYTNTERTLELTFTAVATSENDFDIMWAKINKLVTMVYPQWSQGREVTLAGSGDKNKLIQPFSQVMTASPMIRLRVGDLIRSNYSRFNLARLFGFGAGSIKNAPNNSKVQSKVQRQLEGVWLDGDFALLRANSDPVSSAFNTGYSPDEGMQFLSIAPPIPGLSPSGTKLPLRLTSPVLVQVDSVDRDTGKISIKPVGDVGQPQSGGLALSFGEEIGKYIVYADDLIIVDDDITLASIPENDPAKLAQLEQFLLEQINGNNSPAVILSPAVNPIVKSFEESGGKGLAGFITSVNFDWLGDGNPWETERYGSRAPKMCEISISFSPVHDIAPGIDANGFNRAPLYNVGDAMNGVAGDSDDEIGAGKIRYNSLKTLETRNRNKDQG